jgi:hypothetical protein
LRRGGWLGALALLAASSARAGDGRVEINLARVLAGGVTTGDTPGYPVTLSAPGSYVVTSDLTGVPANTHAVLVTADRVTLDLNGFRIVGPAVCTGNGAAVVCNPSTTGDGVSAGSRLDLRVYDGVIQGMEIGIDAGPRAAIRGVTVRRGSGIGILCDDVCAVVDCVTEGNEADGIRVQGTSRVVRSVARANRLLGINTIASSAIGLLDAYLFAENVSIGNGSDGLSEASRALVVGNSVYQNGGDGIDADRDSWLRRNTVRLNGGAGFALDDPDVLQPDEARYCENSLSSNTGGNVVGGNNQGSNACGAGVCP